MNQMTTMVLSLTVLAATGLAHSEPTRSTVELDGITNVHLLSGYDLILRQGEEEYVTIIADSKYIDEIEARVKGDTLALGEKSDSGWSWFNRRGDREVTFEVQVQELKHLVNRGSGSVRLHPLRTDDRLELVVQGSGEIEARLIQARQVQVRVMGSGTFAADRIEAEEVEAAIHGSGDVEVGELYANQANGDLPRVEVAGYGSGDIKVDSGEAREVEISLSGSGDVDLGNVSAPRAEVSINGSGDVAVYASEELDVSINGSGDVLYRGKPAKIERSIRGSGDIRQGN